MSNPASRLLLCSTHRYVGQLIKRQLLSPDSLPSLISGVVYNTLEKVLEFIIINIQKNLKIKVLSRKSEKEEIRIWLKLLKDVEEKKKRHMRLQLTLGRGVKSAPPKRRRTSQQQKTA